MCKQNALHIHSNYRRDASLCPQLASLGFNITRVANIKSAAQMIRKNLYHLVIAHFDKTQTGIFGLCKSVRNSSPVSVIIVLMDSVKIDTEEQLFDSGVNDVINTKHTSDRVLLKRIQIHLRYNNSNLNSHNQNASIRLGNTIINFDRREVWCNGTIHPLPGLLADLLKYFVDNPQRVISRDELLHSPIWSESICSSAREGGKTFDVNVGKLRKIIEPDPTCPRIIKSVRGLGWKLVQNIIH